MMLAPAMFGAGAAQLAEGYGVAAGFGEEVAAVAEGMGPFAQPGPGRGELPSAEFPGGGDHGPASPASTCNASKCTNEATSCNSTPTGALPVAEGSYQWRGELRLWDNEALIG